MMMPINKSTDDDFGSSRLLHDIEEISKALYLHHGPQNLKHVNEDLVQNGKKSSIWKWKSLKALTHIRTNRLNCCFFLHIHSIEGLPLNFNDLTLCVHWKRKNNVLKSHSIRVHEGVAEFEQTLTHWCNIYVNKSGLNDDIAKYKPKFSLLYVSLIGAAGLDLGKHWIDLTRLLPVTLMELEDDKNRYGKWITSFKLSGKAKGAKINVSLGFSLSGVNNIIKSTNPVKVPNILQRVRSIPSSSSHSSRRTHMSGKSLDLNAHNVIIPYEGPSVSFLFDLLDDVKPSYSKELTSEYSVEDSDFAIIDKGVEIEEDCVKSVENCSIETINVAEIFECDEEIECEGNDNDLCTEESTIEELESFFANLSISESPELDFSFHKKPFHDLDHSLDDLTDTIVDDFMNLVGSDSEPESPRERLLRQFEKESLASGNFVFDLDSKEDQENVFSVYGSSFLFHGSEIEDNGVGPSLKSRRKAKMIENLETEALMQEWGLNERAFQNSPRNNSGAFGSPVYLSPERSPELPPLREGLGSFFKTKNGGFLRSMDPSLFKKAKNGEILIAQVSNSVVLRPEMGFNGMDILMKWARVGPEKMVLQVDQLMPVEEITTKTLQQAAWVAESESESEVLERGQELLSGSEAEKMPANICCEIDSEYVSLENIILLAVEKIQHLLIEGLRIQSGTSNEEPPSTISIKYTQENLDDINELINMSISFSEACDRISKIFEAHDAKVDAKIEECSDQNDGYFSKFTLALRILLRDPLRDYDPVGIPMLGLVQVERSRMGAPMVEPVFKINEVYVTGFRADPGKKQQSGSRWLQSSGITAKTKRHTMSLSKSNVLVRSSSQFIDKMKHEDILWSICSYVHGEVAEWKELFSQNLYARNPDIVFK